jgi:glucose-6-phosphate-specific signal transduction histidine kinase
MFEPLLIYLLLAFPTTRRHDDGAGFDPGVVAGGAGFTNMRDRVAAVGAELAITSSPGRGTTLVSSIIPLRPDRR